LVARASRRARPRSSSPHGAASSASAARFPSRSSERRLELWDGYWNKKYAWLRDDLRAQRFKRRSEIATNHLHDFQDYVLREVAARYDRAGLAPW
jgi:hypothetical protein